MKKKSVTDWREGSAGRMSAAEAGGPDFTSRAFRAFCTTGAESCMCLSFRCQWEDTGITGAPWTASREPSVSSRFAVSSSKEKGA